MANSTLISRNVRVGSKRTCLRLEQAMWDSLEEILERERRTLHDLCTEIDERRHESTLTAGVRVYILGYFVAAATGPGHADAGHGRLRGGTAPTNDHPSAYAAGEPSAP